MNGRYPERRRALLEVAMTSLATASLLFSLACVLLAEAHDPGNP
ncbi:hypothetical protein ACIOWG_18540 [Streptomyces sp. NPDC087658]